jgi:ABC-type dipeptide/oligopeptide/nickel transport system permease component
MQKNIPKFLNMINFIIKRILQGIPVILGVLTISFLLMNVAPGDPVLAMVGDYYDESTLESLREELGLNEPLPIQYVHFIGNILSGDFGTSFMTNRPVVSDLLQKIPFTLQLAISAMCIATIFGVLLGIFSALKKGSIWDRLAIIVSLGGISAPVFWIALLLILWVGVHLQWLPPTGYGGLSFLVLPAIALGTRSMAMLARTSRAFMLDVLSEDYMRTARAKGLSETVVVLKHGLRNVLIPLITIVAMDFGSYLSGAVLTESIFGWPGVGRFALNAIMKRDFPVIQGTVLFMAIIFVCINILVDILYAWTDPRVRRSLLGNKHE